MNLAPGDIFENRYEVRSELGGNEFSVIYRATSTDTGRDVAIRILLPPTDGYPAGFENKFMAESKRVSKLRHAGTVHLESYGAASDGSLYLVTEFISGGSLADVLADEVVAVRDALGLVKRMAQSLGEAHGRGIIHHEFKPGNIAIPLRRGVLGAKLRDFGITKYVEQDGPLSAATVGFGSPRYMSPEQILGEPVEFSANIYSLGLVMYELLTREPCIAASSPREILALHLSTTEYEIPTSVPPSIAKVLRRMIAKSKDDRFATTDELLDAMSEIDRSKLGLTAQLKVAKMVAALEASDDDGRNAADTLLDPNFLDPDAEIATKERFLDEDLTEKPTTITDELTPTNVVVQEDEVTQVAAEPDAPEAIGDTTDEETTDELPDKTKPRPRVTKSEGRSSPRETPQDGEKSARDRSSRDRSSRERSSRERSSRQKSSSKKRRSKRRPDGERRSKRTRKPEPEEDRVSPWVAFGVIAVAIAIALALTGIFLYLRRADDQPRGVPQQVVRGTNPLAHGAAFSSKAQQVAPTVIPTMSKDFGFTMSDFGEVPTGCGIARKPGWATQSQVIGLTDLGYEAYVPKSYTGDPSPLILAVHPPGPPGLFGRKWAEHVMLTRLAEKLGAVMITPEDRSIRPWLKDVNVAHEEFDRVVNHATATFCIDLTRVVGIGMSTGARALDLYSCKHPDRFRALGLVAHWVPPTETCDGPRPAMMVVNGLKDRVSPPEGGTGCFAIESRMPLDAVEELLRDQQQCRNPIVWAEEPDGECAGYATCDSDLVVCRIPEGVHAWPGSQHSVVRCIFDELNVPSLTRFPTTKVMTRFLESQLAE